MPRLDEIRENLRNLEQKDIAGALAANNGAAQAQILARYQTLGAQLADYVDWRDDQLDGGLGIIGRAYSSSETGDSVDDAWSEYYLALGRHAFDRLNRFGDGLEQALVGELKTYTRGLAVEESQFFAQIAAAPLARAAGELAWQFRDLDAEQADLEDNWEKLGGDSGDVGEKIAAVTADIEELFEEVTATLIAEQANLIDKLEDLRPNPQATPTSWIAAVAEVVKAGAMLVAVQTELLKRTTSEYLATLIGLHRMQEGVTVLFTDMRESVRRYLDQRRLATATATFDDAARDARDLAAKCPTAAQRDDAGLFIERVVDEVEPVIDAFELSYKRFVEVHRAVFVGPVGPAAIDAMIQPDPRERALGQLEFFDLEARLQRLVDASAPTIFVDLAGISDQDKAEIRSVFLVEWRNLGAGLVSAKDDHYPARLATVTREYVTRLRDWLNNSKGGEQ
jgi:hypothetical protein